MAHWGLLCQKQTNKQTRSTNYTIITIQTKDKENISVNKVNYKQINKRTNKILT